MGVFSFQLPCQSQSQSQSNEEDYDSNHHHHLQSEGSSLSSQPSLPSIPSLTSSFQHPAPSSFSSSSHQHCISTLKGHCSYVFSLCLAGKHLYSGSSNSHILKSPRNLPIHQSNYNNNNNVVASGNSAVKSIVVVGDKLFSAHQDHKIRVWKINNNDDNDGDERLKKVATLPKLEDRFTRIFSAKNYVQVRRHKKCTWVHHVDTVSALALSSDASLLYSVSWDRTFKIWRTSDFKCLESVWNAHDDAINAVVVSNDGLVYTGSADRKIKVWKRSSELEDGKKKHRLVTTLEKHKSAVNALALSSDGSVLYSGACDRSIIVWENSDSDGDGGGGSMVVVGALRGHTKAILCLGVVSDLVCSGSADKTVRIWRKEMESRSYCCLAVLEGHKGPVKCLTATIDTGGGGGNSNSSSPGNSYKVYSGGLDCDIKVWQLWVQSS